MDEQDDLMTVVADSTIQAVNIWHQIHIGPGFTKKIGEVFVEDVTEKLEEQWNGVKCHDPKKRTPKKRTLVVL